MLDDALKSPQGLEKLLESHVIALSASNQFLLTIGEFTTVKSKFTAVNSLLNGINSFSPFQGILEIHTNNPQVQTSH